MDNLRNVHDHPTFLALLRGLRIQPVWTPTEASWLNLIEAQFGVCDASPSRTPTTPTMARAVVASIATFAIGTATSAVFSIR